MLKDLWVEVMAEEQQRAELLTMFPDLQLSPEARDGALSSPRSAAAAAASGVGHDGGEWQVRARDQIIRHDAPTIDLPPV